MICPITIFIDCIVASKCYICKGIETQEHSDHYCLTVYTYYDFIIWLIKSFWKVYFCHICAGICIICHLILHNVTLFDSCQAWIIQVPCLRSVSRGCGQVWGLISLGLSFSLPFPVIMCLLIWSKALLWMLICSALFNLINLLLFACPQSHCVVQQTQHANMNVQIIKPT